MTNRHINFRDNIISFIVLPLIMLIVVLSFFRFIVYRDYVVSYEGSCDPMLQKCFVGCEDDNCTKEYFYSKMQKYSPDLYAECGKDITDCELANSCLPSDRKCSISFCDPETDGYDTCKTFLVDQNIQNDNQVKPTGEESINNIDIENNNNL